MTEQEAWNMILDIISEVDYDIYKDYLPECSEMSESDINYHMGKLIDIAKKYIDSERMQ